MTDAALTESEKQQIINELKTAPKPRNQFWTDREVSIMNLAIDCGFTVEQLLSKKYIVNRSRASVRNKMTELQQMKRITFQKDI